MGPGHKFPAGSRERLEEERGWRNTSTGTLGPLAMAPNGANGIAAESAVSQPSPTPNTLTLSYY